MNISPRIATTSAAQPTLFPGMRANSDTARALVNAVSAADARTRWIWVSPVSASRSCETEMATNSKPISAPATPALAKKEVTQVVPGHSNSLPDSKAHVDPACHLLRTDELAVCRGRLAVMSSSRSPPT